MTIKSSAKSSPARKPSPASRKRRKTTTPDAENAAPHAASLNKNSLFNHDGQPIHVSAPQAYLMASIVFESVKGGLSKIVALTDKDREDGQEIARRVLSVLFYPFQGITPEGEAWRSQEDGLRQLTDRGISRGKLMIISRAIISAFLDESDFKEAQEEFVAQCQQYDKAFLPLLLVTGASFLIYRIGVLVSHIWYAPLTKPFTVAMHTSFEPSAFGFKIAFNSVVRNNDWSLQINPCDTGIIVTSDSPAREAAFKSAISDMHAIFVGIVARCNEGTVLNCVLAEMATPIIGVYSAISREIMPNQTTLNRAVGVCISCESLSI